MGRLSKTNFWQNQVSKQENLIKKGNKKIKIGEK